MEKTLIAVIPSNLTVYFNSIIQTLRDEHGVFQKIVFGETVNDFHCEINDVVPKSYVFVIATRAAFQIIKEFHHARCINGTRIEWVHSLLTGIDAYQPQDLATFLDAPMSNARGCFSSILAEHVAMCCLYFCKQVVRTQRNHVNKVWEAFPNDEMHGKTMGIIGYGDIGRAVARVMINGFGMTVLGYHRNIREPVDDIGVVQHAGERGLGYVLTQSDFVVVILPKTKETKDFFCNRRFQIMKKSSIFINIGRGSTVRENDLLNYLQSGHLRGAALDVFDEEPLPKVSKLWDISQEKLLLTSHNADISAKAFQGSANHFCKLAISYVKSGTLPRYLVNLKNGY